MKQFAYFAPKIRGNQMYYQPLCWPYLTKPHLIASTPLPPPPPIFSVQLKKTNFCNCKLVWLIAANFGNCLYKKSPNLNLNSDNESYSVC